MATKEEPRLGENELTEITSDWERNLLELLDRLRIETAGMIKYLHFRGIKTLEDFYAEKPENMQRFLSPIQFEKLKTKFEDYQMNLACSIDTSEHKMSVSDYEKKPKVITDKVNMHDFPKRKLGKENGFYNYDMKKDSDGYIGRAVIIVNKDFNRSTREGSDKDRENLENLFTNLNVNFAVCENKTSDQMNTILTSFANLDKETSIVFVAISTHGGENNSIQGVDNASIKIDDVIDLFQKNVKLRGKPKVFLIQACRGTLVDFSSPHSSDDYEFGAYESDAQPIEHTFATNTSDVLIAYATSNRYKAWRDKMNGSWFITELKKTLNDFPQNHLTDILTICAHNVIHKYQTVHNGQIATETCNFHSSLTKFIYF